MTASADPAAARAFFAERVASLGIVAAAGALVTGGAVEPYFEGRLRVDAAAPLTARSTFHICSGSKAFTALAFATLVEGGAVRWDQPVRSVLPEFALSDPWIADHCTFRDLAGMRLGLAREGIAEWGFDARAPVSVRLARMQAMGFDAPFRDRFSYSNLGYIALALAVSRLGGGSYAQVLSDLVFRPVGLADAATEPGPASPSPHMRVGGTPTPVKEVTGDNSQGSARVHLSAMDAGAWLAGLLRLSRDERNKATCELFRPQSIIRPRDAVRDGLPAAWAYAMGWMLADFEGRAVMVHGGGGRGWRAFAVLDPQRDLAALVMTADERDAVEDIALGLLDIGGGSAPRDRLSALAARRSQPAAVVAAQASCEARPDWPPEETSGTFANPVNGEVRVGTVDGAIRFEPKDAPVFSATLVRTPDGPWDFIFDDPAMSPMPGDPRFRARFEYGVSGDHEMCATYFGVLRRIGP